MDSDVDAWAVQIKSAGHSGEPSPVHAGTIGEGFKKEAACEQPGGGWLNHPRLEETLMEPKPGCALALSSQDLGAEDILRPVSPL